MTHSSHGASSLFASRAISIANMASAICGGLSLALAVTAPLTMRMTTWNSPTDVVAVASVRGGLPFLCVASIVLSRWLFHRGMERTATAIAVAPVLLVAGLITLAIATG